MNDQNEESSEQERRCPSLKQLYFYLTEGCNLACRHCWLAPKYDGDGTRYPVLPIELFETATIEAKELGLKSVKLTGGEPLLHPGFTEILEIIRREELGLTIETNGLLCTPEIASEIAKSPRRFVSVSIDGADQATHEWLRGVPGSFEKARQAVRNLAVAGTPPQVIMTVMRHNSEQIEAVIKMAEELGASSVKFNVVQPTARGQKLHEDELALGIEELIRLCQKVEKEFSSETKLRLFFDNPMAFRSLKRIIAGDGCSVCGIFGILGVIASGRYALCGIGENVPEMVFGTVGEDSLKKVWEENEYLRAIRESLPRRLEGICSRCLMKGVCLGACVAQNYYRTKKLWAPYWFCEMAEKAGLFPETRLIPEKQS